MYDGDHEFSFNQSAMAQLSFLFMHEVVNSKEGAIYLLEKHDQLYMKFIAPVYLCKCKH